MPLKYAQEIAYAQRASPIIFHIIVIIMPVCLYVFNVC